MGWIGAIEDRNWDETSAAVYGPTWCFAWNIVVVSNSNAVATASAEVARHIREDLGKAFK